MMKPNLISSSEDAVKYYAEYALEQGEVKGKWEGKAAERLGLIDREVSVDDLRAVLTGHDLEGNKLVKDGWDKEKKEYVHTPGWDLTFSAPKDVSVIWASADEALRNGIEQAQEQAVRNALDQLQRYSAKCGIGAGRKELIDADIVTGLFQHSSNREKEPQLHTHAIVMNVAYGQDGTWRTLDSRHFYKDQHAISAVYKASLAYEMKRLGFEVEKTKDSFAVVGVPQAVKDLQSSRSKALENELAAHGLSRDTASREMKEAIVLQTRKSKTSHHHAEAAREFDRWEKENADAGFTKDSIKSIRKSEKAVYIEAVPDTQLYKTSQKSMQKITEQRSVFERVHLHSAIAESLIGKGSYNDIKNSILIAHQSSELKHLGKNSLNRDKFSTATMMGVEKRVYDIIRSRSNEGKHVVSQKVVEKIIEEKFRTIEPEQRAALDAATQSRAGVTIIQGVAGAGKSYTMKAVRSVYEDVSYKVQGLSPTNKAARELSNSTGGMDCSSIESFLFRLKKGTIELTRKDILIIDEAGMAGSRRFETLMQKANEAKAKVILLGDAKQIQPIEAGQIFGEMHRRFGKEELRKVVRQTDKEEGAALLLLRDGKDRKDFTASVDYLISKDRCFLGKDSETTIKRLVSDLQEYQQASPGKEALIVASRNETVDRINSLVRENLKASGSLGKLTEFTFDNKRKFELAVNDQIVFTENQKKSGIYNSDIARVSRIDGSIVTAIRSDKKEIVFDITKFQGVSHGYAVTAHKSQSTTVDRAFVYADGSFMDKEKVYVAMTRGRHGNVLYCDRASLGQLTYEQRENLKGLKKGERDQAIFHEYKSRLVSRISRSTEKDTTLQYRSDLSSDRFSAAKGMFAKLTDQLKNIGRNREAEITKDSDVSLNKDQRTGEEKTVGKEIAR
ncbi:MAG: conjugative relaxase, partial [Proteobacteria bacterium]